MASGDLPGYLDALQSFENRCQVKHSMADRENKALPVVVSAVLIIEHFFYDNFVSKCKDFSLSL